MWQNRHCTRTNATYSVAASALLFSETRPPSAMRPNKPRFIIVRRNNCPCPRLSSTTLILSAPALFFPPASLCSLLDFSSPTFSFLSFPIAVRFVSRRLAHAIASKRSLIPNFNQTVLLCCPNCDHGQQSCPKAGLSSSQAKNHGGIMYANSRFQLTREYKSISENPPPYITAHPSEANILEYVAPHFCRSRTDSDIEAQMALYNYRP